MSSSLRLSKVIVAAFRSCEEIGSERSSELSSSAEPKSGIGISLTVEQIDARDPQRSLWLKLEYGEPASDGWRERIWFASPKKGKPGFRPGDLVFTCAKDTGDCYAIVEVADEPEYQPEYYVDWTAANDALARWPWINTTRPRLVANVLLELK